MRRIASMATPRSTALTMSYTVRQATDTAVSASISTPVCPVTLTVARTASPSRSAVMSISTLLMASGWQSGISSWVFLAAMMPAMRAAPSTSPFLALPHQACADQECRNAGRRQPRNTRGREDAALARHHAVSRHRGEAFGDGERGDEGLQVAVVDADEPRFQEQGALHLALVVHFQQHVHAEP